MKNNKTKTLTREAMLRNICGLSLGDRAYCGPYGTITCIRNAYSTRMHMLNTAGNYRGMYISARNTRKFSVSGSTKIHNGGNWTMKSLRKAICG